VELGFFFALHRSIRREADGRDGLAALGVAEFGVAGGVADQDNFVDPSHPLMLAIACKMGVSVG
jgi:hypothetical protein